ncbi:neural proliferation differentiation and control protein 1 [Anguilla rostrata]|uniref:neural proliferation differentiation and control protein 1 n=1 Tax=Anguilla rostrata TaxID=7938 RepID=UPI0030D46FA9
MLSLRRGVEGRPPASVLLWAFLCATLIDINASLPVDKCPRTLDCTLEGRHFCQPGSTRCGPCLAPFEEDEEGKCVARKRRGHFGKINSRPELDEEIDFLSSIISKQQGSEVKQSEPPKTHKSKQDAPKRKTVAHVTVAHVTVGLPKTTSPATPPPQTAALDQPEARISPVAVPVPNLSKDSLLVVMIGVCIIMGTVALILAGVCWVRLQREMHLAQKVEYPAFNVMAPHSFDNSLPGDKKLAQSAQMYHYQHQKQQMLSLEKHRDEPKIPESGTTSDEENEDGDFTVYECPGLAPTGEMEVKNPLFDDSTLHIQRNHK